MTPSRLTRCQRQIDQLILERDELVRVMLSEGHSLREVATLVGLSHTSIAKIRDTP